MKMQQTMKRGPKGPMTVTHKAALVKGRTEAKAVREYLEGLKVTKPKRGRKRTMASINDQLTKAKARVLVEQDVINQLRLTQLIIDLTCELESVVMIDVTGLESAFIAVAKSYSDRNGITYAAWRGIGVDPRVLKAAGINRAA